jgi:hypothetical protein
MGLVFGAVDTEVHARLGSRTGRELTAEALRAPSKEFLIKKYSDLCELRVSAVKYCAFQLAAEKSSKVGGEPAWLDLGPQRRKRVRTLLTRAKSKKN